MTKTKRIIYCDIQLNDCDNILVQFTKTKRLYYINQRL